MPSGRGLSAGDRVRITCARPTPRSSQRGKGAAVGVVVASGDILDGTQPPGTVGGESTSQLLREARFDSDISAVVLRIDSPGGSVLASEQIYREVAALEQAGKPVVVSMGDVAASGGYYIAAGGRSRSSPAPTPSPARSACLPRIPTFSRTPGQDRHHRRWGRHHAAVGRDASSIGRCPTTPRKLLQSTVDHTYEEFLARVAKGRGKTQRCRRCHRPGAGLGGRRRAAHRAGRSARHL